MFKNWLSSQIVFFIFNCQFYRFCGDFLVTHFVLKFIVFWHKQSSVPLHLWDRCVCCGTGVEINRYRSRAAPRPHPHPTAQSWVIHAHAQHYILPINKCGLGQEWLVRDLDYKILEIGHHYSITSVQMCGLGQDQNLAYLAHRPLLFRLLGIFIWDLVPAPSVTVQKTHSSLKEGWFRASESCRIVPLLAVTDSKSDRV